MNSRQLDRAAYVAAHAILSSVASRGGRATDAVADIIKDIFEPLCDAVPASSAVMTEKFLHIPAESAARNDA
jgi:hypothetical protein